MANGSAYIFYLKTKGKHRFRNHDGDIIFDSMECAIVIPQEMIGHIERASDYVLQRAKKELDDAKSSV